MNRGRQWARGRVLVCGSRTWTDAERIATELAKLPGGVTIVTGGAPGADQLAAREAHALGLAVELHPADWPRHGRRAGVLRNLEMLESGVDFVLAFWDGVSPGTRHTVREAAKRGIRADVHLSLPGGDDG